MQITGIVVIGAGPLGREIAYLAARSGYPTVLEDVNSETIERALEAIRAWVAVSGLSVEERIATTARISTSRSIEDAMRAAQLVIDTTIDELETKLEVFTIFDKFARPGAILACCTASLSV
jgi:3-hydroxybutyryl-CoA dehydrogenase